MSISRRSFLAALGMTGASLALPKLSGIIQIPRELVQVPQLAAYDGLMLSQWIAAEGIRLLAAELPYEQFSYVPEVAMMNGAPSNWDPNFRQFGVSFSIEPNMSREVLSEYYIKPCMMRMAAEIRYHKPRTCIGLALPRGVKDTARAVNHQHGFDLRYARVFGPISDTELGWVNRFDMLTV